MKTEAPELGHSLYDPISALVHFPPLPRRPQGPIYFRNLTSKIPLNCDPSTWISTATFSSKATEDIIQLFPLIPCDSGHVKLLHCSFEVIICNILPPYDSSPSSLSLRIRHSSCQNTWSLQSMAAVLLASMWQTQCIKKAIWWAVFHKKPPHCSQNVLCL